MKKEQILEKLQGWVIHCNNEKKANEILRYLHERGFVFAGGEIDTNFYEINKEKTCYRLQAPGLITSAGYEHYLNQRYKIYTYSHLDNFIGEDFKMHVTLTDIKYSEYLGMSVWNQKDYDEFFGVVFEVIQDEGEYLLLKDPQVDNFTVRLEKDLLEETEAPDVPQEPKKASFEEGKYYVFSAKKYDDTVLRSALKHSVDNWTWGLDGLIVDVKDEGAGYINDFLIVPEWCEELKREGN